jgi:site-specific DNA-methyltransferase (adenine-specific)
MKSRTDANASRDSAIYCGDVLAGLKLAASKSVQAVVADPPYYNVLVNESWDTQWDDVRKYLAWTRQWVAECMRVLRDDGLIFIFGQPGKREHVFIHLMSELCRRHRFHDLVIWDRAVGYNERRDSFTPAFEMILVLRKSDAVKFNKDAVRVPYTPEKIATYLRDKRYRDADARRRHLEAGKFATSILRVPSLKGNSKEKCGHPSQKPVALIEKLIACATDPGDLVLDPFLGSGTTAVAAESLGRRWIGIEVDPRYVSVARKRLKAARKLRSAARSAEAAKSAKPK